MLATSHTKMAQMEFDIKKAKYAPDKKFVREFQAAMATLGKLKSQLDEVLVKRTILCLCVCSQPLQKG